VPGAKKAIRKAAPGVLAVSVDYEKKLATIGTAKDEPIPREQILDALKSLGYSGQWVEE
jgi:hypothetical protein